MDEADLELVKDWLTRAHQDLRAAHFAAAEILLDVAIYHCQQAGEKAVKAYLQWRDEPFAKNPQPPRLGDSSGDIGQKI